MRKSDSHHVTVRSLTLNHTGLYQCEVSADAPLFHTLTESAHMQVAVLPDVQPAINIYGALIREDNKRYIHYGDQLKASCIASPSLPTVNFTWRLNGAVFPVRNCMGAAIKLNGRLHDLQYNNVSLPHIHSRRPPRPGTETIMGYRAMTGRRGRPGPSCCSPSTITYSPA